MTYELHMGLDNTYARDVCLDEKIKVLDVAGHSRLNSVYTPEVVLNYVLFTMFLFSLL